MAVMPDGPLRDRRRPRQNQRPPRAHAVSQGPIAAHSEERLVTSDRGIVRAPQAPPVRFAAGNYLLQRDSAQPQAALD